MFQSSEVKKFEKILERCTNPELSEVDWAGILELCDMVNDGAVSAKQALACVRRQIASPQNSDLALQCLESLVKNSPNKMESEICAPEFVCFLRDFIVSLPDQSKQRPMDLIQSWALVFGKKEIGKPVLALYETLQTYGYRSSTTTTENLDKSSVFFDQSDLPPGWKDGECCYLCRDPFTFTNRKHHCRNCGDIVCQRCSCHRSCLPKFGINDEVRVCDACFQQIAYPAIFKSKKPEPADSDMVKLDEEEQLQIALALSKSEEDERLRRLMVCEKSAVYPEIEDKFGEMERVIDEVSSSTSLVASAPPVEPKQESPADTDSMIVETVRVVHDYVRRFTIRIESNTRRGRVLMNDTSVQSMFVALSQLNPKLLAIIKYLEDCRAYYECLQDKLTAIKDASEAVDALRFEYQEQLRAEERERESRRLAAIGQKLESLRQEKHEYLRLQKEVQLKQLAIQEQEMNQRLQQQQRQSQQNAGFPSSEQSTAPPSSEKCQDQQKQTPLISFDD